MAERRSWTRDELLIMMNIYEKLPFGQFDASQKVIQDIAAHMERTPGSIAMKLSNLASFDPAILARGRKGLEGASRLDREIWDEFHATHDTLAPQSEEMFRSLFTTSEADDVELIKGVGVRKIRTVSVPLGPTEIAVTGTARRGQQFFRQAVLNTFDNQCAVTGIKIRELLVASHICPWNTHPANRLDPQNGLSLSRLHDAAFDRGLITFDDDHRLLLGKDLRDAVTNATLKQSFAEFEGKELLIPHGSLAPKQEFITHHRENIFRN